MTWYLILEIQQPEFWQGVLSSTAMLQAVH